LHGFRSSPTIDLLGFGVGKGVGLSVASGVGLIAVMQNKELVLLDE
jgi:hypothetical protein